jgi:polar amino acid transport system substrate-binding protein
MSKNKWMALQFGMSCLLLALSPAAMAVKMFTEESYPMNYAQDGKITGLSTEVVQEMGKRTGVPMSFEIHPWQESYEIAQVQKDACVYTTMRLTNRENLFSWIGPIATTHWACLPKTDFPAPSTA